MTTMSTPTTPVEHSPRQKAGFALGAVVALLNIPLAFIPTSGTTQTDPSGPPVAVLVIALVLGVAAAALLLLGWRSGRRGPVRAAAVLLVVVALSAVPAFFVTGIEAWIRLVAGAYVLATIVAIVLLFSPGPRPGARR